jgi:hypothetical protein
MPAILASRADEVARQRQALRSRGAHQDWEHELHSLIGFRGSCTQTPLCVGHDELVSTGLAKRSWWTPVAQRSKQTRGLCKPVQLPGE